MRMQRDGVLKREEFIESPVYFYQSRRSWTYRLLLDWSEPLRHGTLAKNCESFKFQWRHAGRFSA